MGKEFVLYAIILAAVVIFGILIVLSFKYGFAINGQTNSTRGRATNMLVIAASGAAYNKSSQGQLYITVNGTGPTTQNAVQNISYTLQLFNSTIYKFVNGNLSRITTSYYNIYKIYNKTGYQATESLYVIIPNIQNVSSVIGATASIPNIYVTSASPILSDSQISMLRTEALSAALANATSQAYALIGKNSTICSTNISVNNYYIYPYRVYAGGIAASNGAPTPPQIGPQFYGGVNKVIESITVTFYYSKSICQ